MEPAPPSAIREFRPEDYETVRALWVRAGLALRPGDDLPDLLRFVERNPGLFLVAERDGEIVGTVMGADDGRRGWVYHLAVEPRLQGRGIGRRLMAEVEARLAARGVPKVNLHVAEGNERVVGFYRRLGYEPGGARMLGKYLR